MEACSTSGNDTFPEFLQKDTKGLWIFGESESKRRLIVIERQNGSFGFTLQSYGVRYKHGNRETDFITYVNAVEKNGAADLAGLREGDVILSINGQNMARVEHKSLVTFIRQCPTALKMVVVSDERARKVELHMRYVHLQKKLQDKFLELDSLNAQEKDILAGTYNKSSVCYGAGNLGGPCLAAASSVCCFCPNPSKDKHKEEIPSFVVVNPAPSTATISIIKPNSDLEEAKLRHVIQQRSKSVKLPSEKSASTSSSAGNCSTKRDAYLDSYRKSQSSRDLHRKGSTNSVSKSAATSHNQYRLPGDKEAIKPASWDSLIGSATTKAFGGYGYGYGYGYFPTSSTKDAGHRVTTHPHHHNHHSHAQCSHAQNYYKGDKHSGDASKVKVVYNYVSPTYHTMLPNTGLDDHHRRHCTAGNTPTRSPYSGMMSQSEKHGLTMGYRSKTLPSTRNAGSNPPDVTVHTQKVSSTPKMEKTFSDSSLSEHYKELSLAYFQRSGDNVRFPSEDEFEAYVHNHGHRLAKDGDNAGAGEYKRRGRSKSAGKERERIFV